MSRQAGRVRRSPGTLADSSALGHENITNFQAAYGVTGAGGRWEPTIELRSWLQQDLATSLLANTGLRYSVTSGALGSCKLPPPR